MNPDLCAKLNNTNLIATTFPDWIHEVTELDEDLREENARTQCLIDANNATCAAERQKRKPLAERLSDPPTCTQSPSLMGSSVNANILRLLRLTEDKKRILKEHKGCTQCQLDPKNYKTLTLEMALATKNKTVAGYTYAEEIHDNNMDSDSYVPPSDPPLLHCKEYVKLELLAGKGAWSSGVSRAKINVGLPVPLLLGIPFLSSEQIVLDVHARTAIDKRTGFDIMAPPPPRSEPIQNTKPPKKKRKSHEGKASNPSPENTTEQGSTPKLEGREAPDPKTILVMVLERIEGLAFQEKLQKKDVELKEQYAD
ncbi:hypothetical protein H2248_001960 [Termitomyces sp. 'cryptogamus']|nr:hypothetical protein H2248_001960 [Termitomyces sp. 'cryptogamus']